MSINLLVWMCQNVRTTIFQTYKCMRVCSQAQFWASWMFIRFQKSSLQVCETRHIEICIRTSIFQIAECISIVSRRHFRFCGYLRISKHRICAYANVSAFMLHPCDSMLVQSWMAHRFHTSTFQIGECIKKGCCGCCCCCCSSMCLVLQMYQYVYHVDKS